MDYEFKVRDMKSVNKYQKSLIGSEYNTSNYGKLKIIGVSTRCDFKNTFYCVEFIDTGGKNIAPFEKIKRGQVRDYLKKSVRNVGFLGYFKFIYPNKKASSLYLYHLWKDMIHRKNISNEWTCFTTFYNEVSLLKGWIDECEFKNVKILKTTDIDLKYSKNNCYWEYPQGITESKLDTWSNDDIIFLKNNYEKLTNYEISQKLNIKTRRIKKKMNLLGLRRMISDSELIGMVFYNNKGHVFKVDKLIKRSKKSDDFEVLFDDGYRKVSKKTNILNGEIQNPYKKSYLNIGFLGEICGKNHYLHGRWSSMLERCYNDKNIGFKNYGGRGVTVCDRWHNFSNYVSDVESIDGYDLKKIKSGKLQLDKDIKFKNNLVYSKETCLWVSVLENARECQVRNGFIKPFLAKNITTGITERWEIITEFTKENPKMKGNVISTRLTSGSLKVYKGWVFRYDKSQ